MPSRRTPQKLAPVFSNALRSPGSPLMWRAVLRRHRRAAALNSGFVFYNARAVTRREITAMRREANRLALA